MFSREQFAENIKSEFIFKHEKNIKQTNKHLGESFFLWDDLKTSFLNVKRKQRLEGKKKKSSSITQNDHDTKITYNTMKNLQESRNIWKKKQNEVHSGMLKEINFFCKKKN